jgi:hypothetical protein
MHTSGESANLLLVPVHAREALFEIPEARVNNQHADNENDEQDSEQVFHMCLLDKRLCDGARL